MTDVRKLRNRQVEFQAVDCHQVLELSGEGVEVPPGIFRELTIGN